MLNFSMGLQFCKSHTDIRQRREREERNGVLKQVDTEPRFGLVPVLHKLHYLKQLQALQYFHCIIWI